MSFMTRPKVAHSAAPRNRLDLTRRDYEGGMSTLCAGCGHDSITAALVEALWESDIEPHRIAKLSGIGCSSKTPAYFVSAAHGINTVHGRMPSVATGANAANGDLVYLGVSGDGDSLSIGLGQLSHAIRRNLNMVYVIENNGVYGLTKGQFSASADVGSTAKKGAANLYTPIDPAQLAINMGAGFVARSFSGDKHQLVPLLKAAIHHRGFALVDVISPCVTFNDHEGSTKSYVHTREYRRPLVEADLIERAEPITARQGDNGQTDVTLHDGSRVRFCAVDEAYNPEDANSALAHIAERQRAGEIATGLLYIDPDKPDLHGFNQTIDTPLRDLPFGDLDPGKVKLAEIMDSFR